MADSTLSFNILAKDNASTTITKVGERFGALHASVGVISKGLGTLGVAMGAAAIAGASMGVKTAASLEQAQIGFSTLLGSGQKAAGFLQNLQKFAASTPFELPGLVDSSRTLLGVGLASEKVIPLLTAFGDTAGAVGVGQEAFQRIMLATSQAISAGKFQTEDLNQIMENGIPVWSILSKAMGKPVPVLRDMASKGQLLTNKVLPILQKEMGKDYGGAMARQSQTLNGLWSTFMDTLNLGLANTIKPMIPALKSGLTGATTVATKAMSTFSLGLGALGAAFHGEGVTSNGFVGVMERIGVVARGTFGVFKSEVLPRLKEFGGFVRGDVVPALVQFGGFVKTQITSNVIPAVRNLVAVFKPLVIEVGTTLVGAYRKLAPPVTSLGKTIATSVGPALKSFTGFLKSNGTVVRAVAVGVGAIVGAMLLYKGALGAVQIATKAYAAVQAALNFVLSANPIGVVVLALVGLAAGLVYAYKHSEKFREVVNKLGGALKTAFLGVVGFVKDTIRFFKDLPGNVTAALGDTAKLLLKKGQDFITGLMDGIWSIAKGIDKWMLRAPVAKLLAPWYGALKWLIPHGIKFLTGFLQGVAGVAKTVGGWLMRNVITPVVGAFGKAGSWLVQSGKNILSGLFNGVVAFIHGIKSIGSWVALNIIGPVMAPFLKANTWLIEHGKHLIGGLFSGVVQMMKGIKSWIGANIYDPIIKNVKWFFGIQSPSKVFAELGGHMVTGLFKGLSSKDMGKAVVHIFGSMPKALGAIVNKGLVALSSLPKKALDAIGAVDAAISVPMATGMAKLVQGIAANYGWGSGNQWDSLYKLIQGESGFRPLAQNPSSSAFGMFQFLDSTWGTVGGSKTSDPTQQTILGLRYIQKNYGDPQNAYNSWLSRSPHWYANGGVIAEHVLGVGLRSGRPYHIGENGPERVTPMGRGGQMITLRIESGGSRMDDFIAELIRRYVRVNGGDVQAVLGK